MSTLELFRFFYCILALTGQFGIFKRRDEGSVPKGVSLNPVHENCRMFKTGNGYIRLGSRDMRSGDRIALFSSGSMPLVMRARGSNWNWLEIAMSMGLCMEKDIARISGS